MMVEVTGTPWVVSLLVYDCEAIMFDLVALHLLVRASAQSRAPVVDACAHISDQITVGIYCYVSVLQQ
jgi:hypothetical protein